MNRARAAAIHFLISASIVGSVLAGICFLWFPPPLFTLQGAWNLAVTMVVVDVVLGPMMTLIVYKKDSARFTFDLCVIATIQVLALGYGVFTFHAGRPVAIASTEDRFRIARQVDLVDDDYNPVHWDGARTGGGPRLVFAVADGDIEYHTRPRNFRPLREHLDQVRARALPLAMILADEAAAAVLEELLSGSGLAPEDVMVFPLKAQASFGSIVLDRASGEQVALTPYEFEDLLRR